MNAKTLAQITKSRSYKALVQLFPPQPMTVPGALEASFRVIETLMGITKPSPDQLKFLELLSTLVENHEELEYPLPRVSLARALAHLIESKRVSKAEVARSAKVSASTISDVLGGRRSLSTENIKRLSAYFRVSPSLFLDAIRPTQDAA
ncbi:MAG TPA: helix-turn-helix transcriptional regulator [Pirellulales bacterium]|nr:helix-turn-helix transcriptional regulator [Pirellulales bacterium]